MKSPAELKAEILRLTREYSALMHTANRHAGAAALQLMTYSCSLLGAEKSNNQQPTTNNLAQSAIHVLTTGQITAYTDSARAAGLVWAAKSATF